MTAYTADPKYWQDLYHICGGAAYCGDIANIRNKAGAQRYDAIILGEFPDTYENPIKMIRALGSILNDDGILLLKARYYDISEDLQEISDALGGSPKRVSYHVDALTSTLENMDYEIRVFPYTRYASTVKEEFFSQLKMMEEYHSNPRVRELYSEERFDALMTEYVILLRKRR